MNRIRVTLPVVLLAVAVLLAAVPHPASAADLIERETPTGVVVGYKHTPKLPATGGKYHVHDPDRPIPPAVTPGKDAGFAAAPSDATVLFDGKDTSQWQPNTWKLADGAIEAGGGSLITKEAFGDCQLHVEWMAPTTRPAHMMSRGNSGVILMGKYEIQIFDSHGSHAEQIYADGQAASIYGQTPPLVNACRAPGEWQSFDIVFTAPVFEGDKVVRKATVTLVHNGVIVHNRQAIEGPMAHATIVPYRPHAAKLPLTLQGHGSPVRFRNMWIRAL